MGAGDGGSWRPSLITSGSVLRRRRDVRYRVVVPDTVVIRQAGPEVLILNEVAGRILDLADGRRTAADIAETLVDEYDIAPDAARLDVLAFAAELAAAELIDVVEPADGG